MSSDSIKLLLIRSEARVTAGWLIALAERHAIFFFYFCTKVN